MSRDEDNIALTVFKYVAIVFGAIIALFVILSLFTVIDAGTVGVANTFGVVDENPWYPGIHFKSPFTEVKIFNTKTMAYDEGQQSTFSITGLSNEGLSVTMDITVLYHLTPDKTPELYKTVGMRYEEILFPQAVRSVPRDIISKYDAKTLYSASVGNTDRSAIEEELRDALDMKINTPDRGIIIETVSLRHIGLPQTLTNAIESKMEMEQKIQTKSNEIQVQEMEYKRAMVEANQIKDYQTTIAMGISDQFIKWKSLETLEKVGAHGNMVIVTDGQEGMPIILNPSGAKP